MPVADLADPHGTRRRDAPAPVELHRPHCAPRRTRRRICMLRRRHWRARSLQSTAGAPVALRAPRAMRHRAAGCVDECRYATAWGSPGPESIAAYGTSGHRPGQRRAARNKRRPLRHPAQNSDATPADETRRASGIAAGATAGVRLRNHRYAAGPAVLVYLRDENDDDAKTALGGSMPKSPPSPTSPRPTDGIEPCPATSRSPRAANSNQTPGLYAANLQNPHPQTARWECSGIRRHSCCG